MKIRNLREHDWKNLHIETIGALLDLTENEGEGRQTYFSASRIAEQLNANFSPNKARIYGDMTGYNVIGLLSPFQRARLVHTQRFESGRQIRVSYEFAKEEDAACTYAIHLLAGEKSPEDDALPLERRAEIESIFSSLPLDEKAYWLNYKFWELVSV